ncbi:histone-lysine N-methyltransferase SETMAR-like [Tachypleus tridentatus]|uniref:histone-lysine N-methyltransferase SETMAR-like n=1 Tax=Tachypleus tridentatus TaxID=6853 RepID=UPI003FCEF378
MDVSEKQIWCKMLYELKKGNSVAETARNFEGVYGSPVEFNDDLMLAVLDEDCAVTVEELAQKLHSIHSTVHLGRWFPHELTEANIRARVDICTSLHSREHNSPLLDSLVTEDEK